MNCLCPCRTVLVVVGAVAAALSMKPVVAQDIDAMAKWTALTVVHYVAVAEFSAPRRVVTGTKNSDLGWSAPAADRVEIEFDWDQQEMKLVGKPAIRNFPSKIGPITVLKACPLPKIAGTLEVVTASNLRDTGAGGVQFDARMDVPGGSVPFPADEQFGVPCGAKWDTSVAASTTATEILQIPPAMMLAMGGGGFGISADKKSLILKGKEWTWTFTPTPVK